MKPNVSILYSTLSIHILIQFTISLQHIITNSNIHKNRNINNTKLKLCLQLSVKSPPSHDLPGMISYWSNSSGLISYLEHCTVVIPSVLIQFFIIPGNIILN